MARRTGSANDPGRRERIAAAALEVIIDEGVHGTTHRRVAARAAVPLGSLTYHFDGLAEIIEAAFERLAETMSAQYRSALASARTRDEARDAVAELICGDRYVTERRMLAIFELYAYSSHEPRLADLHREWTRVSWSNLALHFREPTRRALDALIEGWTIQRFFEQRDLDRELVVRTLDAIIDALESGAGPG